MKNQFLHFLRRVSVLLLFLVAVNAYGQESKRILFVGNSYTYFWNLPQNVEALIRPVDPSVVVKQSTAGGVSWKDHWEGNKDLLTRQMIEKGSWDIVILQNHSMSGIEAVDEFNEYGTRLINLVKSNGGDVILYTTWARDHSPQQQEQITRSYKELAEKNKVSRAPVGDIWARVKAESDLILYDKDQSHPSPVGTYLTSMIFTKMLLQLEVLELPSRVVSLDRDGTKVYWNIIPPRDASYLQGVVDEEMSKY